MTWALVAVTFVGMEPLTYALHRFVMHGPGRRLHASHHRPGGPRRWEANDTYPAVVAIVVGTAIYTGYHVVALRSLVPIGVGATLYGLAYAFVHDVYIHRRVAGHLRRRRRLDRLAAAHALHHRFGGEPYGMLLPIVPAGVRRSAGELTGRR
jgi:beta-carotene 3-hydroxylase